MGVPKSRRKVNRTRTRAGQRRRGSVQSSFGSHYSLNSNLNSSSLPSTTSTAAPTTTTTTLPSCSGTLKLFSKTYFRGDEFTVHDNVSDLQNFNDRAVTAKIDGNCCWEIFSEKKFNGHRRLLQPGVSYHGVSSFG